MPAGSAANASSVGAKTVNGPGPCSVSTNPAAVAALRRVPNEPAALAVATMSPAGAVVADGTGLAWAAGGSSTWSMTWMTPFAAWTSGVTTCVEPFK